MTTAEPISPRFQSDNEDAGPVKVEKFDGSQLDKYLDKDAENPALNRKPGRGFTVSVGTRPPKVEDEIDPHSRGDKRAQTLPAMSTRRGDYVLSAESQQKLVDAQATLMARKRRGSECLQATIVPQETLDEFWKECSVQHHHGIMTEGQAHSDERERWSYGGDQFPGPCPPVVSCQKGSKGFRDTTPNQDNFSLTYFKNGWTLGCTFDGHGPYGHLVSTRTVQTVPYYLAKSKHFPDNMEAALIESFETAQKDIVGLALEDGWDVQASGSTAVAACWKGDVIWTANAGDSRCVVGSESDKSLLFETEDHKPQSEGEKARIESMGGEVRTQTYPDGWVNHRIFVKGEDYPGLCMARTFGDESVKAHGVVATPECKKFQVDLAKLPFFILASDGVWEFLDSQFVTKAVAKKIKSDGPEKTVQKLQREAKKRWKQEEGDYCDDITSILVQLR